MRSATAVSAALLCLSVVSALPFTYGDNPLNNGFPNITPGSQEQLNIETQAHGTLPNGPPPAPPKNDSLTSLQLIAFNEIFEVAFFTELVANITNNVDGYHIYHPGARDYIVKALTAVQAQEELHALNANFALSHFNSSVILPCQYDFPVSTFEEAIALAATFTDVVLGTLQDVQIQFGTSGDIDLIGGIGAVIGQEGEQNGFYRQLLDKIPSALPFLTASAREFAFSALQGFVVTGSCPNLNDIDIQIFEPLTVVTSDIGPYSQRLQFSITLPDGPRPSSWGSDFSGLSITYINQQNMPVNEKIQNVKQKGNEITFEALFPFDEPSLGAVFGNGLTIAAVTNTTGPFGSADEVAQATVYGPGLIEIN